MADNCTTNFLYVVSFWFLVSGRLIDVSLGGNRTGAPPGGRQRTLPISPNIRRIILFGR